jgi:APA family basic amino acid/polyamine antiporter
MEIKSPAAGQLIPAFGLRIAVLLVVSSIVGSGVYKKIAPMAEQLESPGWILLAWVAAGLVSMMGVLTVAEVAAIVSTSGGPYAYFNRIYGRAFAFTYGWASFTAIQSASIASVAYVFAQSLNAVVPLPRLSAEIEQAVNLFRIFYPLENLGVKATAVGLIVLLTAINCRGVRQGGNVSRVIMTTVIFSLLVMAAVGLCSGKGDWANLQAPSQELDAKSIGLSAFFTAMLGAFWAYEGWITLGFMADEIKNPRRNVPLAVIFGLLIVIALYVLVNFTYLFVLPMDQVLAVAKTDNGVVAVEMMRTISGTTGALMLSLLIAATTAGCCNTTIMAASRIYYAMASQGVFIPRAAHVHPVYNTPSAALVYQGMVSGLLVFSGSFDQLTNMLVFVQFIFYGAIALGLFILRVREPDTPRPIRAIGYPLVPILYLAICGYVVGNAFIEKPRDSGIGLALVAMGLPLYFYWSRRNGKPERAGG